MDVSELIAVSNLCLPSVKKLLFSNDSSDRKSRGFPPL